MILIYFDFPAKHLAHSINGFFCKKCMIWKSVYSVENRSDKIYWSDKALLNKWRLSQQYGEITNNLLYNAYLCTWNIIIFKNLLKTLHHLQTHRCQNLYLRGRNVIVRLVVNTSKFSTRNTLIYVSSRNLALVCKPILYFGGSTIYHPKYIKFVLVQSTIFGFLGKF